MFAYYYIVPFIILVLFVIFRQLTAPLREARARFERDGLPFVEKTEIIRQFSYDVEYDEEVKEDWLQRIGDSLYGA